MIENYLSKFVSFDALIPFVAIILLVFVGIKLISSNTPAFRKQQRKYLHYLLIDLAVMAVVVAVVYNLRQSGVMLRYLTFLGIAFILGGLHVYFYRNIFDKFETENTFKQFIIAFITSLILIVPIILTGAYFEDLDYLSYYLLVIATFVLPTSFTVLFEHSISIPVKLYSKWHYPLGRKYDTPKHNELNNMIVVNFMFLKNTKEQQMTSFKAKAPKNMNFGRLFYFFINDYNDKKTTSKIETTEDSGSPYGWYFYTKPKWYGTTEHIDSELSVDKNNLEEGDVVVCHRI
ncbi:hypothetical protein LCGC14_1560950 [marine sediment metagenome]|uniref:Uncharacterized protein n=2 Tax=root TaxID=1 RepID=A0A831QQ70_9FLAO|nr:hypothetical protein [Pricia antarctica]